MNRNIRSPATRILNIITVRYSVQLTKESRKLNVLNNILYIGELMNIILYNVVNNY